MQMIHNKLARFIYMRRHGKIRIQPHPEVPNSHHAMLSLRADIIYIRKVCQFSSERISGNYRNFFWKVLVISSGNFKSK